MAFDYLLNQSMLEEDLHRHVVDKIRKNYDLYQHEFYYLKLAKSEVVGQSKVIWIKTFSDFRDLWRFYASHEYDQAYIGTRFDERGYKVMCNGFYHGQRADFDLLVFNEGPTIRGKGNLESRLMPDWEIVSAGFDEIKGILRSSKNAKAM
jgi:hypothetical protein